MSSLFAPGRGEIVAISCRAWVMICESVVRNKDVELVRKRECWKSVVMAVCSMVWSCACGVSGGGVGDGLRI